MLAITFITKTLKPRYSLVDIAVFTAVLIVVVFSWMMFKNHQLRTAVFQSPLPDVRVAEEKTVPDSSAYERPYDFTVNWFTHNIPVWEKVLAPFKGKPDVQYLEIGVYEGRSVVWMLENILTHPTARLTGIDVFDGPYKDKCFANIELSESSDKAKMLTGYSQLVLRELPLISFDIIYIDGSHAKDDVLEDAVLCWRLLKENGVMIFDDYRWAGCFVSGTCDSPSDCPKVAVDPFVRCFDEHFEVIHNSYQLILRKKRHEGN
jgi:methyltransferase family protein